MKIAHVTTVGVSLYGLLLNQMRSLRQEGYEVVAISSPSSFAAAIEAAGIRHIGVPITRKITPVADLVSLWRLWRVMRRERFTIVHTHTPKAGLLGQLAARLAGVPLVVNTVHGFYLHSGMNPVARRIYLLLEKLAATCSDRILSQNAEDIEIAVRERVCRREKIKFLGNGIDLTQFNPDAISTENVAKAPRRARSTTRRTCCWFCRPAGSETKRLCRFSRGSAEDFCAVPRLPIPRCRWERPRESGRDRSVRCRRSRDR